MNSLRFKLFLTLTTIAMSPLSACAQEMPGRHPAYLHALTDLRNAHWLLEHQPGDAKVYGDEDVALAEIDATISEIKHVAADDGKDLHEHPDLDLHQHGSRLLQSIESLKKARADIDQEEDNPEIRELRHRSIEHLDRAIHAASRAHDEWLKDVKE
jgi:hypothetical protein